MEEELEPENEPQQERESKDMRLLRQKAKQADELAETVTSLKRENTIFKAKLDLTPRQIRALASDPDVDWDDPESVRSAAVDMGWATPKEPEVDPEEVKTLQRIEQASAGAEHVGKTNPVDEIKSAQSPEEVVAAYQKAGGRIAGEQ